MDEEVVGVDEDVSSEVNELDLSDSSESKNMNDYLFNVILAGDSGVGKTDLVGRLCDEDFQTKFLTTMGINIESHALEVDDKKIKLQIWDPSGSERYMHLITKYFRTASGIVFVYDVSYTKSFDNIKKWIDLVDKNTDQRIPRILVGNKCDTKRRTITKEQGEKLAESSQMMFLETSAISGHNVAKVFLSLSKVMKTIHDQSAKMDQSN